jgi:hypothetical protein
MVVLGKKPYRLAWYALPKKGKSHLGALFVKMFGGVVFDFAKIQQVSFFAKGGGGPAPSYTVANVGDAATACENAGLELDQYRFIKTWEEFMEAIEYAKMYRDGMQKENHRIWVVIDDTTNMRWQGAYYAMVQNKHTSMSQPDWTSCSMLMSSVFQTLESNFNCIFVNQVKEGYDKEKDAATGIKEPSYFPSNLEHIVDATMEYVIVEEEKDKYPVLKIKSMKNMWVCRKDVPESIVFRDPDTLSPDTILRALKFDEAYW